jgi:tetratricopeptide (TPR) repeat protein
MRHAGGVGTSSVTGQPQRPSWRRWATCHWPSSWQLHVPDELHGRDVLPRLADPLDPSASVRYSLGKTLRALSPAQRARFAALGLPEGPDWALPIVERMFEGVVEHMATTPDAGAPSGQADLEALVAYSLVSFVADEAAQKMRVRLHPLVRQLAREEIAREAEPIRRAALAGLLAGVDAWLSRWVPRQSIVADPHAVAALRADEDLIVDVLRQAYTQQVDVPLLVRTTEAFLKYLGTQMHLLRVEQELATLQLQAARLLEDHSGELAALRALAFVAEYTGRGEDAAHYRQAALPLAHEMGDRATVVEFAAAVGATAAGNGVREEAQRRYDEALAVMHEMGDLRNQPMGGRMLNILGILAAKLDYLDDAAHFLDQASICAHETGDWFMENQSLYNLADIYEIRGEYEAARSLFEQVFARERMWKQAPDDMADPFFGFSYDKLGEIALKTGNLDTAAAHFAKALHLFEASDLDPAMIPHVRGHLAAVQAEAARRRGDIEEARRRYQDALAQYAREGRPPYDHMVRNYLTFVEERLSSL